jgi:hypothetical protein
LKAFIASLLIYSIHFLIVSSYCHLDVQVNLFIQNPYSVSLANENC